MSGLGSRVDDDRVYDFSVDKDLHEIWPEVITEFERVTHTKLDAKTTFESFQVSVDETLRGTKSKRSSNARKTLNHIGQCLQQFGSIIAGAAGTVFGPSAQCWNAISFVISVAQKYSDVFDGFIALMERCSAFLSRLNVFLRQECGRHGTYLPNHLRKPAYAILSHFIEILKSSYKLSNSKREKFKLVLEVVLFSGDAGVQSALDLLETQVRDFTDMQITDILVDVKGLAKYMRESDEGIKRHLAEIRDYMQHLYELGEETLSVTQQVKITLDGRMTQEKNREDLATIRIAFDLKEGEQPWTKRHNHLCKKRLKESGLWIVEREDLGFSAWADAHDPQGHTKILTVEGDTGYGKSFITNDVVTRLQNKYRSNNSAEHVFVAYYYYGEDKDDSLEKCLRSVVYQFASTDPAYAVVVAKACQPSASIAQAEDIWKRLITNLQHAMKGTYYICIDGFENPEVVGTSDSAIATIARSVLSGIKGMSIRFYLTGTNDTVAQVVQDDPAVRRILLGPVKDLGNKMVRLRTEEISESTLMIPLVNSSDLEAFALARVEEMGKKKPDLKSVMTETNIKKLLAGVRGHYEHLEAKLIQINACDTEQNIQRVIDSIGDDLKTSVRGSLKVFINSLGPEQIEQLNELLVWVVAGKVPSIDILQSALYLAFRRTFMLRDLIATTFSSLLAVDEFDRVKLKSDLLLQILREESSGQMSLAQPILVATELAQAEIDLCRHIVRNVCGEHVYGRFKFDDFFNSLAGKQNSTVRIDGEDAQNVVIARSLLQALCEPKEEIHLEPLREHASIWFYEYLRYFVEKLDYFEPNREHLSMIGAKLSQVLYDVEGIGLWLSTPNLNLDIIKHDLIVSDRFLEPIRKLLRNPHTANGYNGYAERKEWIQSVISAKANKFAILEKVAINLATKWFTSNTAIEHNYFRIPYDVFLKHSGQEDTDDKPSLHHIKQFLQWIRERTELHMNEPVWSYRVGAMYHVLQHPKEASRFLREVEPQLADNWSFLLLKAEVSVELEDYSAALDYFHKVKALHPVLLGTDKGFEEMYCDRVLLAEADCHRKIKDYDSAVECCQEILGQDIGYELYPGEIHANALTSLFTIWSEAANHDATLSFLRELKDNTKAGQGLTYWLGSIIGSRDTLQGHVVKAAKQLGAVEEIARLFSEVTEPKATGPEAGSLSPQVPVENIKSLRYFQAALRFHGSDAHHDHVEALKIWEELVSISNPNNNWDDYWVVYRTSRVLARALLDKGAGKSSGRPGPASTSSYMERLKTLCNSNQQSIRGTRQSTRDPHICLVRLHLLNGNKVQADEEARNLLRGVFDDWPADHDDDSLYNRFRVLAQVLTVYGSQDDAVAAWQALKPRGSTNTASGDEPDSTVPLEAGDEGGPGHSSPTDASPATLQAQLVRQPLSGPVSIPEAYVSHHICDSCSKPWTHMLTECWACRNCLCVQLCTPCHDKLITDDINPLVCSKQHDFIYIPKFDEEKWSAVPDDMILVGGKPVAREQWLNNLRERFDVQQEQIEAYKLGAARKIKATLCIANFVAKRVLLRKNRMKVTRRARTFPLLQVR